MVATREKPRAMPRMARTARVTSKGQVTLPKAVRDALGVEAGGRVTYVISDEGVSLQNADQVENDPVTEAFLQFLARDMTKRPERVTALSPALMSRIAELVDDGGAVDAEDEIDGEVAL